MRLLDQKRPRGFSDHSKQCEFRLCTSQGQLWPWPWILQDSSCQLFRPHGPPVGNCCSRILTLPPLELGQKAFLLPPLNGNFFPWSLIFLSCSPAVVLLFSGSLVRCALLLHWAFSLSCCHGNRQPPWHLYLVCFDQCFSCYLAIQLVISISLASNNIYSLISSNTQFILHFA